MFVWLTLFACVEGIVGIWEAYSFNKSGLPISNGVQDFSLFVEEDLEGDFRLEIMQNNAGFIYTFPLTAESIDGDWVFLVDNSENETYPEVWDCQLRGRLTDCTVNEDVFQVKLVSRNLEDFQP